MQNISFVVRAATKAITSFLIVFTIGCGSSAPNRVVLYCAQDQEFAEQVLGEFTRRSGTRVDPKYDTEADKSVSLYTELLS
jgi:iron(III) transport system substrate-binding protein